MEAPRYEDIDQAITAGHLLTPLATATWLEWDMRVDQAARILIKAGFDQAPVRRADAIRGYAMRGDLRAAPQGATVGRVTKPVTRSLLVSEDAPVSVLLEALQTLPVVFVVGRREIAGFVTPSDLGRHAARTHFYLLLSDLEMILADMIRSRFADRSVALGLLSITRSGEVKGRHDEAAGMNRDIDYVGYMHFSDLLDIAGKDPFLRSAFGAPSRSAWSRRTGRLDELRNFVMHPTRDDLALWTDVTRLYEMELTLRELIRQAGAL